MKHGNTLHFINRVDDTNCGDRVVTPLLYYYDYFKQYNIKRHDQQFIDYDSIDSSDVVILGGGGLLDYAEYTNRHINRLLDTGATVIAWAPGINTHTEQAEKLKTQLDFASFTLVKLRDYENKYGIDYLPDVTCKLPDLKKKYTIKREIGIARHKDYPIEGLPYDEITNVRPIDEILRFIGESDVIVSNSFHMIYWAILMGKKTICANPFSTRFYSYKYKPEYFYSETDNLAACVEKAKRYDVLDECIQETDNFFSEVRTIIESKLTPVPEQWRIFDLVTEQALLVEQLRRHQRNDGDLLVSNLYIDTGCGFSEDIKRIAINNVLGDQIHTVKFDLSDFEEIHALRFDPIEFCNCEVEIISAGTASGNIELLPQTAVSVDGKDRFLTTDPQYLITQPCSDFIEICFFLRIMDFSEASQTIYSFAKDTSIQLHQQNELLMQRTDEMEEQAAQINQLADTLGHRDQQIAEQDALLNNQAEQINQLANTLGHRDQQIAEQDALLNNQAEQINQLADTLGHRDQQIAEQDALLNNQAEQINQLADTLGHRDQQIAEQDALLNDQAEQINQLTDTLGHCNNRIAAQDALLNDQTEQINLLNDTLSHRENLIASQDALLNNQAEQINQLADTLCHRENQIAAQDALLNNQTEQINQLADTLCHRENQIAAQDTLLKDQVEVIGQLEDKIADLNKLLDLRTNQIEMQNALLQQQSDQICQQTARLEELYNSISWKITAPLRKIINFFKHLGKGIRKK